MRDAAEAKMSQRLLAEQINPSKETVEKCNIAKKYIEERYERLFEEEKNRLVYWSLLNKKMGELKLSGVEQKLIRDDFLKQEALLYREK